ncbi:MAG: hypothetical protein AAFS04_18915 [Cyanobacteria bacterium J06631_9]
MITLDRLGQRFRTGDLHRTFGRFKQFRSAYSFVQNSRQRLQPEHYRSQLSPRETSNFDHIDPEDYAKNLRTKGVSFGFSLPPAAVAEVYRYACETPCTEPGQQGEFYADDVQNGRLKGGRTVFRGLVKNPEHCRVVKLMAQDPALLEVVRRYLHYWPTKLTFHLSWSFAVDMSEQEQREIYPPLNYHYDVAGYNFMTTYFYITDIDADTGAHVMIERSHNQKPLNTLFTSGADAQLAQQVLDYYGADSETVIEGKAGFGFVQDPSCFHRLSPLKKGRRLLLQIRYS